ncbi:MAG: hypothetical protein WA760_15895 [Pseudolabrys sp.]
MNTIFKYATAAALTGALALAAASPSEARNGRNAAAIGFGVGAVAGAVIAGSAYNSGYYGEPGYAYSPGYAYGSYGYDSYAYEFTATAMRPAIGTAAMDTATPGRIRTGRTTSRSVRSAS